MQKALKHIIALFIGVCSLAAIVLRTIQLFIYTDIKTGYIIHSAKNTIFAFYALCLLILALCGALTFKSPQASNPFCIRKSKAISVICYLTSASFFYDFVHQSLNCYNYASQSASMQYNFIIPLALVGISALMCAYYFYIFGASFNSERYDLRSFKYFHLMPASWIFFRLLTCIVTYTDKLYDVDAFFQYAVLIFGIIFYILIVECLIDSEFKFKRLAFTSMAYGIFALIISTPRLLAGIAGADTASVTFSSITYFFTGIFALAITVCTLREQKEG